MLQFVSGLAARDVVAPEPLTRQPACACAEATCLGPNDPQTAAMDQMKQGSLEGAKLTPNLSVVLHLSVLKEHRLCISSDATLLRWRPAVPELRLIVIRKLAKYKKPVGLVGFMMTSVALPLLGGLATILCILMIGHHRRRKGLFSVSHALRLLFILTSKALAARTRVRQQARRAHTNWEASAVSALKVLETGVACGLSMSGVQGKFAVGHHAWYNADADARRLRALVVLGLTLPVVAAFVLVAGLLVCSAYRGDSGGFIAKSTLKEHPGSTACLVLLCLFGVELCTLLPWQTEFMGLPGRAAFDVYLLVYMATKLLAFGVVLVYSLHVYEVKSSYLTALYGLELAHTIATKLIYRLGHCCGEVNEEVSRTDKDGHYTASNESLSEELWVEMADIDSDEAVAACDALARNHGRHFIASQRQRGLDPSFIEWIHELHPENCRCVLHEHRYMVPCLTFSCSSLSCAFCFGLFEICRPAFSDTEGVDPRIHAAGSNFRRLWSEALALQHEGLDHETTAQLQAELLRLQTEVRGMRWKLIGAAAPPALVSDEAPYVSARGETQEVDEGKTREEAAEEVQKEVEEATGTPPATLAPMVEREVMEDTGAGLGLTTEAILSMPASEGASVGMEPADAADRSSALGTHALMTEEVTEEPADNCALTGTGGCQRSMVEPPAQAPAIEVVQGASGLLQPHSCNYASRMSRAREFNAAGSRALMGQGANIVQHTSMDPRNPPTRAMKPQV